MAEKKIIDLEVKSNVEESIAGLKALKRQLKDTAAGSAEFKNIYNQIDDLEDKIKSAKNTSSDWVDSLEGAGGTLGVLGGAINKVKVSTQTFGGALKATGIGLIVALLGGLAAAFSENEGAMKKLQPLLDGIGKLFQGVFRVVEPLFNTLVDLAIDALPMVGKAFEVVYSSVTAVFQSLGSLGSAIKKLISGDFSGAWKDAKASVNDFSSNYDKSVSNFQKGSKEMTKNEKEEADKRAEERKKQQEKREVAQEKAKQVAIEKAQKEADELKRIEDERLAKDLESAKSAIAILDELNKLKETPAQKEEREYQEKKAILEANNLDLTLLTQQHESNLALITKTESEKKLSEAKTQADKEIEIAKQVAEQKKVLQDSQLNAISAGIGLLSGLAGKNKALQKAAIIAESAMGIARSIIANTASNVAVAAQGAALAIPTAGASVVTASAIIATNNIATGIGIAANIAATAKALSSVGGGGAPSSGGVPSGGGGNTSAPVAPSFNVVGASATNQLAQTIGNKEQQPIKAYVVSSEVSTAQSLDRNIISSASIG